MIYDFTVSGKKNTKNVFEYNISSYLETDSSLILYSESNPIRLDVNNPTCIAVLGDSILVADAGQLQILSITGEKIGSLPLEDTASCLTASQNGLILIGLKDKLLLVSHDLQHNEIWSNFSEDAFITSIATIDTLVYIADAGNAVIYLYNIDGRFIRKIGEQNKEAGIQGFIIPSHYFDIAIGRNNELWVANPGRHQLESYNSDGKLLYSWQRTAMTHDGFCGCCNPTHIAILQDGNFITSEKGIERVKEISPDGNLIAIVAPTDLFTKGTRGLDIAIYKNMILVLDPKRNEIRIFSKDLRSNVS